MAGADDEPEAPARHDRRRLLIIGGAGAALIALAAAIVLLAGGGSAPAPARADATPYDGRSPREPSGRGTRVIVELPRPSLGEAGILDPERQRTYVQSLEDESAALRSALGARGIRLSDVVVYTRTFDGFAATVDTGDLADLPSLGVRAQPARRFYPATSEPARIAGLEPPTAAAPLGGASVAVLDTGVDKRHPLLANRLDRGYDAIDRDRDPAAAPDPRGGRRETSGTALAGILVAAGERVLPIRVAGLQPAAQGTGLEDVAVSDTLLAGLERAVDPNGDGATDDHVPIAVVGVNSPYAGFEDSPEAQAVTGAADLGTLVIAPAGGEGAAAGTGGTLGSPAAAPDALAIGALTAPGAVARIGLTIGGTDAGDAALLAGPPPPSGLRTATGEGVRGRLAVVRAGDDPGGRAAAAAAAGARAVLLADPRDRPLPSIPAGRVAVPVLGVTGAAAEDVLGADAGAEVEVGGARAGTPPPATLADADEGSTAVALSPFSSRGPAAAGAPRPDVAAPGAALTALPGGGGAIEGGTAVAAARAAIEAARLARERPNASPRELRRALIAGARPDRGLPARGAGAGAIRQPPQAAAIAARTRPPGARTRARACPACVRVVLANEGASAGHARARAAARRRHAGRARERPRHDPARRPARGRDRRPRRRAGARERPPRGPGAGRRTRCSRTRSRWRPARRSRRRSARSRSSAGRAASTASASRSAPSSAATR